MKYKSSLTRKSLGKKGFTFIEIMVVVVIIGLVMAIVLPNYIAGQQKSNTTTCVSNQKILYTAGVMYMMLESDSLEDKGPKKRLTSLYDEGYVKGDKYAECPASKDGDNNDYTFTFEDGTLTDIECKIKPSDHVWP